MGIKAELLWTKRRLLADIDEHRANKPYQDACEFYNKYKDKQPEDYTNDELIGDWQKVFNSVLKYFGFNRRSRKYLFYNLCDGNWGRLHMTKEEEYRTETQWLVELTADVFYCSDRWSFDRLMRNHWKFRNVLYRRFVLFHGKRERSGWYQNV